MMLPRESCVGATHSRPRVAYRRHVLILLVAWINGVRCKCGSRSAAVAYGVQVIQFAPFLDSQWQSSSFNSLSRLLAVGVRCVWLEPQSDLLGCCGRFSRSRIWLGQVVCRIQCRRRQRRISTNTPLALLEHLLSIKLIKPRT